MCIVFFYTHNKYKIPIKAQLTEIISQGDIVKVTNRTKAQKSALFIMFDVALYVKYGIYLN